MKLSDLKAGDTIFLDDGFTCAIAGEYIVQKDNKGFYFDCIVGKHYLDGQESEEGDLVGVSSA